MNLLTDPWIPLRKPTKLEEVLCQESEEQLHFHRDDMELAALQLAICLTQVLLMPEDKKTWQQRRSHPLTPAEYRKAIEPYQDLFVLNHPTHPFMQTRGVSAKEVTPIQKLFIGLPEGNNHAFFNDPGELTAVPAHWAAIALFNQASNCPNFGGGFKGTLRGEAPLTTFIQGPTLRQTIGSNILTRTFLEEKQINLSNANNHPVWTDLIKEDEMVYPHHVGLLRGLFWQPARVELIWDEQERCIGLKKEKFNYHLEGIWLHPHSPRILNFESGQKEQHYASFRNMAPAWTQLNRFLLEEHNEKRGHLPAWVVTHYQEMMNRDEDLKLIVGGYRNKQASIIQRRHEVLSLARGWQDHLPFIQDLIHTALEIKNLLVKALKNFGQKLKGTGSKQADLSSLGEQFFYQRSENFMYTFFIELDFNRKMEKKQDLIKQLSKWTLEELYDEITAPYQHDIKRLKEQVIQREKLRSELQRMFKANE